MLPPLEGGGADMPYPGDSADGDVYKRQTVKIMGILILNMKRTLF